MSITADSVKRSDMKFRKFYKMITDHLLRIDQMIVENKNAYNNISRLVYELPTGFLPSCVAGISYADAQRYVYGYILQSLINRVFKVEIDVTNSKAELIIYIHNELPKKQIAYFDTLLKKHRIRQKQIAYFDGLLQKHQRQDTTPSTTRPL
jgi:hypothetical protein